jgi:hypothetical protein
MSDKFDETISIDDEVEAHALTLHVRDDKSETAGQNSFRRNRVVSPSEDDDEVEGHSMSRHHRH